MSSNIQNTAAEAMQTLISISRRYGADPEYVLAGGGNTSLKQDGKLYVKASGQMLASIDEAGFAVMDQQRLQAIWNREYPADLDQREEAVLEDMMAARVEGETARPSVEALLHSMLPQKFIVHLHPALVNGLTCAAEGEQYAEKLFGNDVLWVPLVNPGYILAKTVRERLLEYRAALHREPLAILLQNHGIFIGGETAELIQGSYDQILETLSGALVRRPDLAPITVDNARRDLIRTGLAAADPGKNNAVFSFHNRELAVRLQNEDQYYPISSAFTPDHIVYSGFKPLWIPESVFDGSPDDTAARVRDLAEGFTAQTGMHPKTVVVQNTGVFTFSENALALYLDTVKVAAYAESFGGPLFMTDEQIDFIRNWEVEKYRARVAGE